MALKEVGSIFRELGEGSSLHGLPKIISSKQVANKIFWAVIVVGASVLLGVQLQALYEEFTRYPTKTSIKLEYGPIEFPAVTLCNMNPIKLSNIGYFPNVSEVLDKVKRKAETLKTNSANSNNDVTSQAQRPEGSTNSNIRNSKNRGPEITRANPTGSSKQGGTSTEKNDMEASKTQSINDWYTLRKEFFIAFREAKQSLRLLYGHAQTHLILTSMFNQESLPRINVEPVLSPEHGTCYTINVDKFVQSAGSKAGLKLVLFLDKQEYLGEIMDGYGIKVVVHERGTFPMPNEEGFELNPGHLTDIGMRRKTIDRYGPPYGDCIDGKDFKNKYGVEYSIPVCFALCRMEMTWVTCGCVPYMAPELIGMNIDRPVCPWPYNCIERIADIKENPQSCNCLAKCHEHIYESRFTSRRWPNPTYLQDSLYASACVRNISSIDRTCEEIKSKRLNLTDENYKGYSEDFAGLRIFYETLVYETVVEEPLYSTITFLSDVGGSMGFFLGASLITYLELVHLLVELTICLYKHFSRKRASVCPDTTQNDCDVSETEIPEKTYITEDSHDELHFP